MNGTSLVRLTLGLAVALLLGLLLLAAALNEEMRLASAVNRFAGRGIENGAVIYGDACAGCHGVAGEGVPGVAPALNQAAFFTTRLKDINYPGSLRDYIEATVAAGRPISSGHYSAVMPAWDSAYGGPLRQDEIQDVASFILNWEPRAPAGAAGNEPTPPGAANGVSPVELGRVVYRTRQCVGCHGWPGQTGVMGPDLAGIATRGARNMPAEAARRLTPEAYIRVSILAPSAFVTPDCPAGPCPDLMPRDYGTTLSQEEIDALVRYLLTLTDDARNDRSTPTPVRTATPQPPAPVPPATGTVADLTRGQALYTAHCTMCHGERGQGGMGPALSTVGGSFDPHRYAWAAIAFGVPGTMMPAWAKAAGGPLTDAELNDVAAYTVELGRSP